MSHVPEDQDTDNDVSMNYATPVSILQDSMLLCGTVQFNHSRPEVCHVNDTQVEKGELYVCVDDQIFLKRVKFSFSSLCSPLPNSNSGWVLAWDIML